MPNELYLTVDQLQPMNGVHAASVDHGMDFFQRGERFRTVALISADVVGFMLVFLAALAAADSGTVAMAHTPAAGIAVPIFTGALIGLYNCGQYSRKAALGGEYNRLWRYSAYAFMLHLALNLTLFQTPRQNVLLLTWIGLPPAAVIMRRLASTLLAGTGLWSVRTVLAGSARATAAARSMLLARPMAGLQPVGVIDHDAMSDHGEAPAWGAILARYNAKFVVVAAEGEASDQAMLKNLTRAKIPAIQIIALDHAAVVRGQRRQDGARAIGQIAKKSLDFAAALAMCVIAAPALILLAVIVRLDGGPALFGHERVGHRGRTFYCLKFRTMAVASDRVLEELLARDPAAREEWAASRKLRNDPRVTRVGRFLRATSLDELPQLLNVLRGEMSLVGPRPIVPAELPRYGADVGYYLAAVPGVTGLWQVSGRSDTSYEQRVQLDSEYVRNWSFWTDLAILFKTVPAVLLKRGAV